MWMSFTLTSRRHPSHKCLAQGPQELNPALSGPITSASSNRKARRGGNSPALELIQWTSTSQSDCRDVSWMDTGGKNPKMGHWMPAPNLSCHLSHTGTSVTLGTRWEGWTSPGWGGGTNSPPLGTDGYPICLTWLWGSSPASATLMLQCTNTLAVLKVHYCTLKVHV